LSRDPLKSAGELRELLNLLTLPLGLLLVRGERQVRWIVNGIILVAAAMAVLGLAQLVLNGGNLGLESRIHGPLSHYMTFSGLLVLANVLLISDLVWGQGRRSIWKWVVLVPIQLAIVNSLTRSAWVGMTVAGVVLLLLWRPRRALILGPVLVVLLSVVAPAPITSRARSIFDPADRTNYDRICMAHAGWLMFKERPLFGQGPNLVDDVYPIYRHATAWRKEVPHLHSTFFQLAAERGAVGLLAYVVLMVVGMGRCLRLYRQEGGREGARKDLLLGTALALLAFNVSGFFEDNWSDAEIQRWTLFLLALPFCLEVPGRDEEERIED
jgi:O-antigen ligase